MAEHPVKLILDTSIYIPFINQGIAHPIIESHHGRPLIYMSAVVLEELYAGALDIHSVKLLFAKTILPLAVIMLLTGCLKEHVELKYPLTERSFAVTKPALSQLRLDIEVFGDIRREVPEDKVLFDDSAQYTKDGRRFCINAEKKYEPNSVAYQISKAIATHLTKRGAFKAVSFENKGTADYYVTGNVRRFYGEKMDPEKVIGPLPLGSPMPLDSPSKYVIEFTDLQIFDATGHVVQKLPDINDKYEELSFGSCKLVFAFVNRKLKLSVDKLANNIEDAVVILQSKNNQ